MTAPPPPRLSSPADHGRSGGCPPTAGAHKKRSDISVAREVEATIAIAGYNCQDYLEQAVASALCQDVSLEVIIVDDASSDSTGALARRLAHDDPRIRVIQLPVNMGPAGARNAALDAACGRWFCILDADDLMHPDRLKTLIACADAEKADLIADDLIVFDDANARPPSRFLKHHAPGSSEWLTLAKYLRSTRMSTNQPNLGYLKPIIRLARLKQAGLRYAEQLRIGEDDHFVLSMLLAGFRYRVLALPCYYYRKHSSSISHRLSSETITQIASVARQMEPSLKSRSAHEKKAYAARMRSVTNTAAFVNLLNHVRGRAWSKAIAHLVRNPGAIPLLRQPPLDKLRRWTARGLQRPAQDHLVLVVYRTRHTHLAALAADQIRTMGRTPAHLVIDDRPASMVARLRRRFSTGTTHIPATYFQRPASGDTIAGTRLAILQAARLAELAVVVAPVPKRLAREFLHLSTPLTHFNYETLLGQTAPDRHQPRESPQERVDCDHG